MKKIIIQICFIIMFCIISGCIYIINTHEYKDNNIKKSVVEEKMNTNEISLLYYKYIDNCSMDTCISKELFNIQLNYLKINGYKTITINELIKWNNNEIELSDKSVLLLIENNNEDINNIVAKYDYKINNIDEYKLFLKNKSIPFSIGNNLNDIPIYLMKNNMSMDKFNKIINKQHFNIEYDTNELAQDIAVLNYHFLYEYNAGCKEEICLSIKTFEEQLSYLINNNYKTLTPNEFASWLNGEIELPKKSVFITFDDGACGTSKINGNHLVTLIEKYNINATLYLITGWWDINDYISPNLTIQSHTFDMHKSLSCGYQMSCSTIDQIKNDLTKSIDIVKDTTSFAYPFYYFNNDIIEILKTFNFKIALAGGNVKANRNNNKYLIPRYVIYNNITLEEFINMIE